MKLILSLGTSNKSASHFWQDLKNYKISTVIDVRDIPQSRHFPHFNRKRLAEYLEERGIRYVWMGETLGNPKQPDGSRSLDGFREHMRSESYRQGFADLLRLLDESGHVAIVCAEADESQCHRQFILRDLRAALERRTDIRFAP